MNRSLELGNVKFCGDRSHISLPCKTRCMLVVCVTCALRNCEVVG